MITRLAFIAARVVRRRITILNPRRRRTWLHRLVLGRKQSP